MEMNRFEDIHFHPKSPKIDIDKSVFGLTSYEKIEARLLE